MRAKHLWEKGAQLVTFIIDPGVSPPWDGFETAGSQSDANAGSLGVTASPRSYFSLVISRPLLR